MAACGPVAALLIALPLRMALALTPGPLPSRQEPLQSPNLANTVRKPRLGRQRQSLTQAEAASKAELHNGQQQKRFQPASWFNDFSDEESTFTEQGLNIYDQAFGRAVGYKGGGLDAKDMKPGSWFAETPSAGDQVAWQTYPAGNPWKDTPEGFVQDYKHGPGTGLSPAWFDTSVLNVDKYGRDRLPYPDTPQRLVVEGWLERAINTTFACATVECTASTTLQAYNPYEEQAKNCKLNIAVHATDYDNIYGGEIFENIQVNGYSLQPACEPQAVGCNQSAWAPLYPCVTEQGVDHLLNPEGALSIQGKLKRMVDECPYEGNLLSGVAIVTCLVKDKMTATVESATGVQAQSSSRSTKFETYSTADRLQCRTPGCTAALEMFVEPTLAIIGGTCLMNITVQSTDFDETTGLPEQIEFLSMEDVGNLATNLSTGLNPCTASYEGSPLSAADQVYNLVTDKDVTAQVLAGVLHLQGKISEMVDECPSNGFLLDCGISVRCTPPANAALKLPPEDIVPAPNSTASMLLEAPSSPLRIRKTEEGEDVTLG